MNELNTHLTWFNREMKKRDPDFLYATIILTGCTYNTLKIVYKNKADTGYTSETANILDEMVRMVNLYD